MRKKTIGIVDGRAKAAAGIFWADYAHLGATVRELEAGGVDWIHMEMRDGKYMNFDAPRGGIDVLMGIRPETDLEIEVQLQMVRPTFDLYRQLKDEGADMITIPLETTMENAIQDVTFIKEYLELKVGVWAWQGLPISFFEQYIPIVDAIEYESRAIFWQNEKGKTPHIMDQIMYDNISRMYQMVVDSGREKEIEIMEDGGLTADNTPGFVKVGMTVGEYSSAFLKGADGEGVGGRFKPGTGKITAAAQNIRQVLDGAAAKHRGDDARLK